MTNGGQMVIGVGKYILTFLHAYIHTYLHSPLLHFNQQICFFSFILKQPVMRTFHHVLPALLYRIHHLFQNAFRGGGIVDIEWGFEGDR